MTQMRRANMTNTRSYVLNLSEETQYRYDCILKDGILHNGCFSEKVVLEFLELKRAAFV